MTHSVFMQRGKVALVTGAGRGIGREIALKLAHAGADIGVADIDLPSAQAVAAEVLALGRKSCALGGDTSKTAEARSLVQQTKALLGRIDILVNNAGITRDALLAKMTEDQWDSVIAVNLKGVFVLGQAAAAEMAAQKSGRIVNISSVAHKGNVGQSNYAASKAGVLGLTRTWAVELARFGITVNAIAPGFIDTAMTQKVPAEIRERLIQRVPLKRMGKPEDIANTVLFLCSDEANFVTGQCIQVDGGLTTGLNL